MEINNLGGGDAQFNQAAFQQARLDKLFSMIDVMSVDLFSKDIITGRLCYELVFNNLNSVLSTISPKLTKGTKEKPGELDLLEKFRDIIRGNIEIRNIYKKLNKSSFASTMDVLSPDLDNRNIISDLLFKYRIEIERVMDIHGLANPNKEAEAGWD